MANTVFVRLKDKGSIWQNMDTNESISGPGAKEMKSTGRLRKAIQGGALVELSEKDALQWNKDHSVESTAAEKPSNTGKGSAPVEKPLEKMNRAELDAEVEKLNLACIGEGVEPLELESSLTNKERVGKILEKRAELEEAKEEE